VSADVKPVVLFVCVHNAGRSQVAAALLERYARDRVLVRSAGTAPADELNPAVVEVMREVGIDLTGRTPTRLTTESASEADVVITMGCGDTCPVFPGKSYRDWPITDPAGLPVADVRAIRDDIDRRVRDLVSELIDPADGP
jgi:arsenate reductase (thioredoxin)